MFWVEGWKGALLHMRLLFGQDVHSVENLYIQQFGTNRRCDAEAFWRPYSNTSMEASPLQVWCCKNNGQATRIDVLGADPNVDDLKKAAIPNLAPAEYSQVTITTCDDKVLDPRDELHPLMAKGHGVNKGKDLKVLYAMPSAAEPQA
eukprot:1870066-Amphidinium_carterae.1